jgi:hypothetical protein
LALERKSLYQAKRSFWIAFIILSTAVLELFLCCFKSFDFKQLANIPEAGCCLFPVNISPEINWLT